MADATVLKEMNLGKIRAVLCSGCSLSKTALADITGLSFPTVGKIVDEMVKTRELQAMGMQSSSGWTVQPVISIQSGFPQRDRADSGRPDHRLVFTGQPGDDEEPGTY